MEVSYSTCREAIRQRIAAQKAAEHEEREAEERRIANAASRDRDNGELEYLTEKMVKADIISDAHTRCLFHPHKNVLAGWHLAHCTAVNTPAALQIDAPSLLPAHIFTLDALSAVCMGSDELPLSEVAANGAQDTGNPYALAGNAEFDA